MAKTYNNDNSKITIFKNKITFKIKSNIKIIEEIEEEIKDSLFWSDLYFNYINGYLYITSYDKVFSLYYNGYSVISFKNFLDILIEEKKFECYSYGIRASKSILQDMENGY